MDLLNHKFVIRSFVFAAVKIQKEISKIYIYQKDLKKSEKYHLRVFFKNCT